MEQYAKYLRKSRFDRDYAEMSVEETLKRHEAVLDRLARERGYPVVKTYYEVVSGESIAARPEIQKLLEEVNAGLYAGVLVVDVERLARGNGADQAYISQVFQLSGTKIITPSKVYDPLNEFDEEYFEFGLFMSRREYKTINRRLLRGRDASAREGKYLGSVAPYGYRRVKLPGDKGYTLQPDPREAETVRRVYQLFLEGNGTKMIANSLNDAQIPTRRGGLWTYATIAQMLSNPVYTGQIKRGWKKQTKTLENGAVKKRYRRAASSEEYSLYPGIHPAIIDMEAFDRVQALRLTRQRGARVKKAFTLQNAFAGLIYCRRCGMRIARTTLSSAQHGRARLRCVGSRVCHNASADYEAVEKEIISALEGWLQGYRLNVENPGFEKEMAQCREQLQRLAREQALLQTQLDNAFDLVEQGVYTPQTFKARSDRLTQALDELSGKQALLSDKLAALQDGEQARAQMVPQTQALLQSYHQMDASQRNRVLKTLLRRIEYEKSAQGGIQIDLYPLLPKQ